MIDATVDSLREQLLGEAEHFARNCGHEDHAKRIDQILRWVRQKELVLVVAAQLPQTRERAIRTLLDDATWPFDGIPLLDTDTLVIDEGLDAPPAIAKGGHYRPVTATDKWPRVVGHSNDAAVFRAERTYARLAPQPARIVATPTFDDARPPQTVILEKQFWRADLLLIAIDLRRPASRNLPFVLSAAARVAHGRKPIVFLSHGSALTDDERAKVAPVIEALLREHSPRAIAIDDAATLRGTVMRELSTEMDRFARAAFELIESAQECRLSLRKASNALLARTEAEFAQVDATRRLQSQARAQRDADLQMREAELFRMAETYAGDFERYLRDRFWYELERAADPHVWVRVELPRAVDQALQAGRQYTDKIHSALLAERRFVCPGDLPSDRGLHSPLTERPAGTSAATRRQQQRVGTVALTIAGYVAFGPLALAAGLALATFGEMDVQHDIEKTRGEIRDRLVSLTTDLVSRHRVHWLGLIEGSFSSQAVLSLRDVTTNTRSAPAPLPPAQQLTAANEAADRLELAALHYQLETDERQDVQT